MVAAVTGGADLAARVEGQTAVGWLRRNVAEAPDRLALRRMRPDGTGVEDWSWARVGESSARLARAFGRLGLARGDRALLFLRNRPEFHVADLGVLLAGGTPLSIYNSSAPEQIGYLAAHSRARVAVVDDIGFLERLLKVRDELPELRAVVVVDDPDGLAPADVLRFADLLGDDPVDLDEAAAAVRPEDLATVIYTSGTTGPPKGVMLDHANLTWQVLGHNDLAGAAAGPARRVVPADGAHRRAGRDPLQLAVAARRGHLLPGPDRAGGVPGGGPAAQPLRPAPGLREDASWHRGRGGRRRAGRAAGFAKARQVGRQVADLRAAGQPLPDALAAAWAQVDAAAFAPVRERIGLDQLRYCVAGAAPLPVDVLSSSARWACPSPRSTG